jgi:hypothetical protein
MLKLVKSVVYYTFNLSITLLMTTVFIFLNANIGPPSLG